MNDSSRTAGPRVGWIGTGRMGAAMAARLARAGTDLTVWNRTRAKAETTVLVTMSAGSSSFRSAAFFIAAWSGPTASKTRSLTSMNAAR